MAPPPFGILGMWVTVRVVPTSQEICCSGFETQGGYSKLIDAHPELNPNGRYAADCVHLGTSSFS